MTEIKQNKQVQQAKKIGQAEPGKKAEQAQPDKPDKKAGPLQQDKPGKKAGPPRQDKSGKKVGRPRQAKSAKPTWRRRKQARPSEIIAAAFVVFSRRGYSAARMDDVAAEAGVTKGTIYLYFPNKEALFRALVREAVLPHIEKLDHLIASYRGSRAELISHILNTLGGALATSRLGGVVKLVIAESGNFPALAEFYFETVIARGLKLVGQVIEEGIARAEFRPCDVAATTKLVVFPLIMTALWKSSFEVYSPLDHVALIKAHGVTIIEGIKATGRE